MSYRIAPTTSGGPPLAWSDAANELTAAVAGDSTVLSVALLGALVVLVSTASWWVSRRLMRTPGERFRAVLAARDEVAVLMHPNPDPDAMACAMAVATLAESVGTEATLQYPGQIRHQENRAFRTVLDLELDRIEGAAGLAADDVVLVDHNTIRGFTGGESIDPIAVIDHHPGDGTGTEFTDVRPEYGAASTILVEYLTDVGAPLELEANGNGAGPTVSEELATGLLYGIHSDTNRLTNGCSAAEFEACSVLVPGISEDRFDRIANPQVSEEVLQTKVRAISDKRIEGSFAICDVGELETVDALAQAADELLRLEGVTAVVVYGSHDGTLHLSGRSRDDRVHMGESLQHAVADVPMASAGGHARMGGGQLSIDHMRGIGPSDGINEAEFEDRVLAALAGER